MRSRRLPTPPRRRGVLLLVVLSMLTLFMLLGVTYLVIAARTRATSRAFLKLEDDLTANSLKVMPLVREAAMQVIRGTQTSGSVIRYHDLLADRYKGATTTTLKNGTLVANGALVRFEWSGSTPMPGRVLTFKTGPDGVRNTSVRIADARVVNTIGNTKNWLWVPRPRGITAANVGTQMTAIFNGAEFDGTGFKFVGQAAGKTDLNDAALMPNRSLAFSTTFEGPMTAATPFGTNSALISTEANEDYDAVDEQNMALAWPDGSAQSFVRPGLIDLWVRDYYRRQQFLGLTPAGSTQADVELELRAAMLNNVDNTRSGAGSFAGLSGLQQAQTIAIHALRRASMRPFAFDHWQDDARTIDFAGRPLQPPALSTAARPFYALAPTTSVAGSTIPVGDVDNDGDGVKESVWLDLGMGVTVLGDGKAVKPLFAIHCIDLGGRVALNANGSPVHAAESSVLNDANFAPRRKEDANGNVTLQTPTRLRGGLAFGPADVRLDQALDATTQAAVMFGLQTPSAVSSGVQRDTGPVVGRYGDKIGGVADPALPGVPWQNDRRVDLDGTNVLAPETTTDRGLPGAWKLLDGTANPPSSTAGLFVGSPPDPWARWAVGADHRGQPHYANRTPSWPVAETTDNPYELDLLRQRQGMPYVQSSGANDVSATVDQPFTASELESILRPYDVDNAMSMPPRLLSLAANASGGIDLLRFAATTDNWDTPGVIGWTTLQGQINNDGPAKHDPDLLAGLRMDLNRPFGDAFDNDGDGVVDEPRETLDAVAAGKTPDAFGGTFTSVSGTTSGTNWLLTRGELTYGTTATTMPAQAGPEEPHLRARQLFAYQLFNLARLFKNLYAPRSTGAAMRLFAVDNDVDDNSQVPVAKDSNLNNGTNGDRSKQDDANDQALAQWAVNVVDFMDPDAIMTPFTFRSRDGVLKVVWGCEFPDVMITETLAFHDRRTADTKGDPTGETTVNFFTQYKNVYDAWVANGKSGPAPDPQDPDNNPDTDDRDFDQVRIPEGSLFLELHCLRNPRAPSLPRELYSWDATKGWYLDVGRVPAGGVDPVWRLSIADSRIDNAAYDVFKRISEHPDTTPLSPGATGNLVAGMFPIDRYVWLSPTAPPATGTDATLDNTFYRRDTTLPPPKLAPGGYLVVGPRPTTAIGSIDNSAVTGSQKWGVPSKQQIALDGTGSPAVVVTDLKGNPSPGVTAADVSGAKFGNPLPPATLPETAATWVSMEPPSGWSSSNLTIGLNVSAPLRSSYYPQPTVANPASGIKDAYGDLASENHGAFRSMPLDRAVGTPLSQGKLLSGGTYANYKNVFVERLADPTRPHVSDATSPDWNPYIVVDFMPVDLTIFNGESTAQDPSETQGRDRGLAADLPVHGSNPGPVDPTTTPPPFPIADSSILSRRHTFFHSRQRGFGVDLPNYDNDRTLFGAGTDAIQRNGHPFKPVGGMDDLKDTPLTRSTDSTALQPGGRPTTPRPLGGLAADEKACFLHELGQGPAGRTTPSDWKAVPYHSLGWVNSSFGRRLDVADGIPAAYAGVPDRPFPWLVWNDRPFANVAELAFVPMTPPSRLLSDYRNLDYPSPSTNLGSNYPIASYPDYPNAATPYNKDDMYGACTPGAHLLPMTALTDVAGTGATRARNADLLCRLFDLVRVRSPFVGAEVPLKGIAAANMPSDGRSDMLLAPFNRIPTWREPGRININTIPPDPPTVPGANLRQRIWNAVCADATGNTTPSYAAVAATTTGTLTFPGSPAVRGTFNRPFRTSSGSWANALFGGAYRSTALLPQSFFSNPPGDGAAWVVPMPAGGPATVPTIPDRFAPRAATLFRDVQSLSGNGTPLFAAPAPDAWTNDPGRNAWFRFESLVRAHTNTTVRSELYAIWVTMGLFEVTADTTQAFDPSGDLVPIYPDGYRLVREYGSDSGDVSRHRGFYIFDRSVPVGYETGSDNNVKDAILVERFIE